MTTQDFLMAKGLNALFAKGKLTGFYTTLFQMATTKIITMLYT